MESVRDCCACCADCDCDEPSDVMEIPGGMVAVTELLMLSSSPELSMRVATPVCVMEELVKV